MKLLFAGFGLVIGFTIIAYTILFLLKFANYIMDRLIKKEEDKLKR
jgi:hypothetical protein